jgi:hypothetical protein
MSKINEPISLFRHDLLTAVLFINAKKDLKALQITISSDKHPITGKEMAKTF